MVLKSDFWNYLPTLSKLYLNASKNGDTSKSAEAVYWMGGNPVLGAIPISPYLIAAPGDCQMRKSMRSGREPVAWAQPFGRWHQDLSDGTWYDLDITKLWVWGLGDPKI